MENASKALLIAASVLIAILLIALEVRVVSSTSGTTDQVEGTMQTTEAAMFNSKFMQYNGNNKSKNDMMSLINLIIANNSTNNIKITIKKCTVYRDNISYTTTLNAESVSRLNSCLNEIPKGAQNRMFKVKILDYTAEGYIKNIEITNN